MLIGCLMLASGCNSTLLQRLLAQPTPAPTGTAVVTVQPTNTLQPTQPVQPTASDAAQSLRVWLPPELDPKTDQAGATLMQAHLRDFQAKNPGLKLDVRVKASSGPGNMLAALEAAGVAAPAALPSLVVLSRADLETAALKGLVYPLDGLTKVMSDQDWYTYAREMAVVQGGVFGLPLSGDALVLLYRPEKIGASPVGDWTSLLGRGQPLIFPAGDPQALVTLTLYRSLGGKIVDDQRRPAIDTDPLVQVMTLYASGARSGFFPNWLAQYQTDGQAWQAYREGRGNMLVTWSSRYLAALPPDTLAVAVPALGSMPYTLASGWVLAVSDPDPQRRAESVRLAESLVASDFQADWSAAMGYLPTRPSALAAWSNQNVRSMLGQVVLSAQIRPTNDLLASLGPLLQDSTVQVIKNQMDPVQAAQTVSERLTEMQPK